MAEVVLCDTCDHDITKSQHSVLWQSWLSRLASWSLTHLSPDYPDTSYRMDTVKIELCLECRTDFFAVLKKMRETNEKARRRRRN